MDKNGLSRVLEGLGLKDKEAKLYLGLLSLGPTTILKLAETAGIKRTSCYGILQSLKAKGLVHVQLRGSKHVFAPEHPDRLETVLEDKRIALQQTISEFQALYNLHGGESLLRYYEGLESVKSIYETLLRDMQFNDDYLVIANQEEWLRLDAKYFKNFVERRASQARLLKVAIQLLFQDSPAAHEHKKYEKNYYETVKILPAGVSLATNLVVTPRRLVIHQLVPPIQAIVIENRSIVQMHKNLFSVIWNTLPGR